MARVAQVRTALLKTAVVGTAVAWAGSAGLTGC